MKFLQENVLIAVLLFAIFITPYSIYPQDYQNQQLPAEGVVTSFRGNNLIIREAPPTSTVISYKLAPKKYSIGVGTKFLAIEKIRVANGEIWFHIFVVRDSAKNLKPFNTDQIIPDTITGWMVGKVKSGWLVSFSTETINRKIPANIASVNENEMVEEETTSVFIRYIFIVIGALGALLLVELNRIHSMLNSKTLFYQILLETIIVIALNILLGFIILNSSIRSQQFSDANLKQISEVTEFLYSGPSVIYLLIGFLFSLVCLHFVSFARRYN